MKKGKPEYERFFLPNGLEVITILRPEQYTASLAGYFRAGSAYENKKISGASHFVEHLLFRGNKIYPTPKELEEKRAHLGLSHGASTDYDHVGYGASFPPSEIENALELSGCMLFESLLKNGEIEKERQIIIEEELLREDNYGIRSWDLTLRTRLKEKGHPLSLPREGLMRSIKTLKPKILKNFYRKHFTPANFIVVIGSSRKSQELKKTIEKVFKKFKKGEKISPPKFSAKDFSSFCTVTEERDIEKTYLYFTFPAFSYDRSLKERLALLDLARIFQVDRLDKRLSQERGLSYDWRSSWTVPAHPIGIFCVYSSCEPKNLGEIVKIFFEELKKLKKNLIENGELDRTKNYHNKITPMDFDSLFGAIDWFLYDFFKYKRFYPPQEVISERGKLTSDFLHQIAREIIDFKRLNVTVLGPTTQKEVERMVKREIEKL